MNIEKVIANLRRMPPDALGEVLSRAEGTKEMIYSKNQEHPSKMTGRLEQRLARGLGNARLVISAVYEVAQ